MIRYTSLKQQCLNRIGIARKNYSRDTIHAKSPVILANCESAGGIYLNSAEIHPSAEVYTNPFLFSIDSKNSISFGDVMIGNGGKI